MFEMLSTDIYALLAPIQNAYINAFKFLMGNCELEIWNVELLCTMPEGFPKRTFKHSSDITHFLFNKHLCCKPSGNEPGVASLV
jgi:hypothetical protein